MSSIDPEKLPKHVAIIMDGNGRWAKKRTFNRIRGHEEGAKSVREIVRASSETGIQWLTLYAFSEENWKRPRTEVTALMKLLKEFLIIKLLQKRLFQLFLFEKNQDLLQEDKESILWH